MCHYFLDTQYFNKLLKYHGLNTEFGIPKTPNLENLEFRNLTDFEKKLFQKISMFFQIPNDQWVLTIKESLYMCLLIMSN